jgi:hypothetical protein
MRPLHLLMGQSNFFANLDLTNVSERDIQAEISITYLKIIYVKINNNHQNIENKRNVKTNRV